MKILLIDDKADLGWKQLIEKLFPIPAMVIDTALTMETAINRTSDKYDLIFLDVRLDAKDHENYKIEEFSGYKILKEIKKEFLSVNFATPIILLTATNKVWNIDAFRNYGVNGYYIKEHPDNVFDKETSKQNYDNLKNNFIKLIDVGRKKEQIWYLSKEIIDKICSHFYFQGNKKYENVKARIIDKLKLGFVYLFKEQSLVEKELLKTNNEALAFIIYWSILEEIVKGFSDVTENWDATYRRKLDWKFRNKEYFIEVLPNDNIKINFSKAAHGQYIKREVEYKNDNIDYKNYIGIINLSLQVYGLLAAYIPENSEFNQKAKEFKKINKFRNEVDFIHSNVQNIYEKELIDQKDLTEHFEFSVKVLKFIHDILKTL